MRASDSSSESFSERGRLNVTSTSGTSSASATLSPTLDFGLWTLDSGLWTLDLGLPVLHSAFDGGGWTLDSPPLRFCQMNWGGSLRTGRPHWRQWSWARCGQSNFM